MSWQELRTDAAPKPTSAFVQEADAGGAVYISGQLGIDPASGEPAHDVRAETERALLNLEAVLAAAGLSKSDVAKTTVFLTSLDDYSDMNDVYTAFFGGRFPARSTVQVAGLVAGARVEIEAIATRV